MTQRHVFSGIFICCAALLATAFNMEYVMGLEPCPLCWLQRYAFMAVGLIALAGAIHNPVAVGGRIYGVLLMIFAGLGIGLAGRQLWLQSLPPGEVPACGPSVDYMLEVLPWREVLETALRGTGDCAEVTWRFLGLSIPGWTSIFFALCILAGLVVALRWIPSRKVS